MSCDNPNCECVICADIRNGLTLGEAQEKHRQWAREQIETHGFYVHFTPLSDIAFNYHTHGVETVFHHPDLQIVVPLPERVVIQMFHNVVAKIKAGRIFESGDIEEGIVMDYNVKFIDAVEGGRKVLRIVVPDSDGHLDESDLTEDFSFQYQHLETI